MSRDGHILKSRGSMIRVILTRRSGTGSYLYTISLLHMHRISWGWADGSAFVTAWNNSETRGYYSRLWSKQDLRDKPAGEGKSKTT